MSKQASERMSERRGALLAILLFTMTATSYQIFAISVLAVDIIDDLDISRTALGLLGSLNTLVGAILAPSLGRLTDRIGARRAIISALTISSLGMALMALSASWPLLAASAAVSGLPQAWGNPATNALIAERVAADAQGMVTGVKQSGVQVGIFLAGFTLPGLSLAVGWRGALWGYAGLFLVGALMVSGGLTRSDVGDHDTAPSSTAGGRPAVPGFIWRVSLYAFLFGSAGGAIGRFFPLWANEVVGLSVVVAGILVALGGLLGIVARLLVGQIPPSRMRPARLLTVLAVIGAVYCATLLITPSVGSWILWPSTILYATGIGGWNVVAMLAAITSVPREAAGRASGVVMLGFLGGLSVGSPVAGAAVDRWDTYQPVWFGALVLSVMAALVTKGRPGNGLRPAGVASRSSSGTGTDGS